MRRKDGRHHSFLQHELLNHWHDSKEQDHGTCEVCHANDVENNINEMWKNDGADGENSQMHNQHQQSVPIV